MTWIFYSLLAALLWAIVNVTDKYTMSKLVDNPTIPLLILGTVGLIVAVAIYSIYGFTQFTAFHFILAFLAGLFYVLTMFFYYLALKREEVSTVIPIYYLSPVFILFIAQIMLDEHLAFRQYLGIASLVTGAILIAIKSPLQLRVSQGIACMLVAALCYALNQVLTKYLLKHYDFWPVFAHIRIGIFLTLLPPFCLKLSRIKTYCKKLTPRAYEIMTFNQLLNLGGVFAITLAMTSGYVTLVNALASVQPFFVLVLSLVISLFLPNVLNESLVGWTLVKKFIATLFIFVGVLIIS